MKKLFYIGIAGLALFEILNVYFIMPMPGSQQMNSIDLAYFLYGYRWYFRVVMGIMILAGSPGTFQSSKFKWIPGIALLVPIASIYFFNFKLSADAMFKQTGALVLKGKGENTLNDSTIVVGVENNGEVRAYPIRYINYHHQVQDIVAGKPVLVTYCSVCRTGRVYEPTVRGHAEKFRLVGMDHFNAMFEDVTTKSWWRQATGAAITGPLKGEVLAEIPSTQVTLGKLFELYPSALVMQLDLASKDQYDSLARFERGKSKGKLTRMDSLSWKDKSWVVGIELNSISRAYDWNLLKEKRVINDQIGGKSIAIALADDNQSFIAFERPSEMDFSIRHDSLFSNGVAYDFYGRETANPSERLKNIVAYQEFWHSWRTFHPDTEKFQ